MLISKMAVIDAGVPGVMCWSKDREGNPYLFVGWPASPDARGPGGVIYTSIYPNRQNDDWGKPGPVKAWDGDWEKPTLRPSINVPGHFHGFIVRGRVCRDQNGNEPVGQVT